MSPLRKVLRVSIACTVAIGAAGCRTDGFPSLSGSGAGGQAADARPSQPPVNMAGRWLLAQPGRGQCNMNFRAAAPTDTEGTIAPEGGCPGKFFTSRKWTFDSTGLSIRDHNSEPLAQLSAAGGVRFDGKATTGDPISLTR